MFRRLPKPQKDSRRERLTALVAQSQNVPRTMKAMAYFAVQTMSIEEVDKALSIADRVAPMVEAGDVEGIREVLNESGLPPAVMEQASKVLANGWGGLHD